MNAVRYLEPGLLDLQEDEETFAPAPLNPQLQTLHDQLIGDFNTAGEPRLSEMMGTFRTRLGYIVRMQTEGCYINGTHFI